MNSRNLLKILQLSGHTPFPLGMSGNVLEEGERHGAVTLLST